MNLINRKTKFNLNISAVFEKEHWIKWNKQMEETLKNVIMEVGYLKTYFWENSKFILQKRRRRRVGGGEEGGKEMWRRSDASRGSIKTKDMFLTHF